jgi:hypothetical protein
MKISLARLNCHTLAGIYFSNFPYQVQPSLDSLSPQKEKIRQHEIPFPDLESPCFKLQAYPAAQGIIVIHDQNSHSPSSLKNALTSDASCLAEDQHQRASPYTLAVAEHHFDDCAPSFVCGIILRVPSSDLKMALTIWRLPVPISSLR